MHAPPNVLFSQIGSASKKAAENDTMIANAVERGKFEKGVADSIAANIPLLKVELNAVDAASEKRIDVVSSVRRPTLSLLSRSLFLL
jgi:hypothetical protein